MFKRFFYFLVEYLQDQANYNVGHGTGCVCNICQDVRLDRTAI